MISDDYQNKLRYLINRFIFDKGFAPDVNQLSALSKTTIFEVENGLKALADNHALVLHPNSLEIWIAHPFALFPTLFWVRTEEKQWWGNCAWCSFGIASLTTENTRIYTKLEGEEHPLTIHIRTSRVVENDYVAHFPVPASKFWDNVIYTCANILIFKKEKDIDEWCLRHNKPKGQVIPLDQLWELSKLWYGNYILPSFKRKSKETAEQMFETVGLKGDFWKLGRNEIGEK
jgi:hypothetical protein